MLSRLCKALHNLDNKYKEGDKLITSAAANSEILFSLMINPNVLGAGMPGGTYAGNQGGSNIREAFLVNIANAWLDRQNILDPIEAYLGFNGVKDVQLRFRNTILTTLDTGAGTQKQINLTYYHGYDFINTIMNDAGFHRQESDTEKGLYKYQEDAVKSGFRNNGFNALDTMLRYIESHIDVFELFKSSPNYTLRRKSIIPDTLTFDAIFDINSSRLVFLKLCRFIAQVEDFKIGALLGAKLYEVVKSEIVKDSPDARILALIPHIQRPLAYLAVSRASFQLGMNVTDKGLFFESQETTLLNSSVQKPLTDQQYFLLAIKCEKTGNDYLELLRGFLVANSSDYPTIYCNQ